MTEQKQILAVDDDPINIEVILGVLEDDYNVISAFSGEECLSILQQHKDNEQLPDLLLLDVKMPGLSGIEVCKSIRADSSYDSMPIIFISGLDQETDQVAGYQAGAEDYINKPFNYDELSAKVEVILSKYESRKEIAKSTAETSSMLMTNLTNTSEIGQVMQFIQDSYNHKTIEQLVQSAFRLFSNLYQLNGSIFFVINENKDYFFNDGMDRPLEKEVLFHINQSESRLVEFGSRTGFNSDKKHITILIRNMPNDADKAGRLKDHLIVLIDALELRLLGLKKELQAKAQKDTLAKLIHDARTSLTSINEQKKKQTQLNRRNFETMYSNIENLFLTIGIDDTQEETLIELIHETQAKLQNLCERTEKVESDFNQTMQSYLIVDF